MLERIDAENREMDGRSSQIPNIFRFQWTNKEFM